ncbi:MAG: hypothetical protein LBO21_01605 [Synergistaceae bacterium]|nr:hypothetical protein [Synergistaceae bacterium]
MSDAPRYVGDWSGFWDGGEALPLFLNIEWLEVLPRNGKHRGRLIADEVLDETDAFIALLKRINIPDEEKNGRVVIYGYKKAKMDLGTGRQSI